MKIRLRKRTICRYMASSFSFNQSCQKDVIEKFISDLILFESEVMCIFANDFSMVWEWLNAPAIAFNGLRPIDISAKGNVKILREHLVRLEYGVYT
jgi:uncharacterized protein (DUF2384 family)